METTMMQWAIYYCQRGLSIIPVKGKVPLIAWKEFQERKADEEEIKKWWAEWPEADIGCVTGPITGRLVLDIDGDAGIKGLSGMVIPPTQTVRTKRGIQHHFGWHPTTSKTTIAGLIPQVDLRGEGGYVKLPPSQFSDGSGRYSWIGDINSPIANTPEWLINLLVGRGTHSTLNIGEGKQKGWIAEALANLTDGTKHQQIVSVLGRLRHDNYAKEDAFAFISPYTRERDVSDVAVWERINSVWGLYQPKPIAITEAQTINDFLKDEQKVEWLVPGIIAKGCLGFVAGLQETGKTWALIDLAIEMARGGGLWLGKFPVKAAKVLFIDQERHKSETQRRFKAVLSAKGLEPTKISANIFIQSGTTTRLNQPQSFDSFKNKLNELHPDIVIIDSFATFHTVAENDRTEIQKVLEQIKALRNEFGCSFIFINHEGKSILHNDPGTVRDPHSADMMGSVAVPAAAEMVLTVRRKDQETCMIYHTKSTMGPKIAPFTLMIQDVKDGIAVKGY